MHAFWVGGGMSGRHAPYCDIFRIDVEKVSSLLLVDLQARSLVPVVEIQVP